jgi:RNA polymerase sigma factor (sigma-70 family)
MTMPFDAMSDTPDDALLILYANGDGAAAAALTARLAPRAFAVALRLLQDRAEAEDVTQEAMLRLWQIAPKWQQEQAKPSTWLFTVVRNLCLDRLRRPAHQGLTEADDPADGAPSAHERLQGSARRDALTQALSELPPRQRLAVELRHLEELSNPEIAAVMDIGVEAVESLVARGKRALTQRLAARKSELGYEDDQE